LTGAERPPQRPSRGGPVRLVPRHHAAVTFEQGSQPLVHAVTVAYQHPREQQADDDLWTTGYAVDKRGVPQVSIRCGRRPEHP
jgi:hypothetical protein